jgi:hypothetical protein
VPFVSPERRAAQCGDFAVGHNVVRLINGYNTSTRAAKRSLVAVVT